MRANPTRAKKKGNRFLLAWVNKEQDIGNVLPFPGSQGPASGVFGKPTTEDQPHYACAAHRPLKLKPDPIPPTLAEIAAADALVRSLL